MFGEMTYVRTVNALLVPALQGNGKGEQRGTEWGRDGWLQGNECDSRAVVYLLVELPSSVAGVVLHLPSGGSKKAS